MPSDKVEFYQPYLLAYTALNGLAFVTYGLDKFKAIKGYSRTSEFRLLILVGCGGWIGANLARFMFRHKTSKTSFIKKFYVAMLLHFIIIGVVIALRFQ
jgi:uncharacterized membrane protein YsdA (DUF1294 family)